MNAVLRGGMLIVLGMAIIGMIDNLIRMVAEEAGLFQFHFLRACIAVPILLLMARAGWLRLGMIRPGWVLLRTLFFAISMMLYFSALPVLPIAQVGAGLFTAPIFVLVLTVLVLRRPVGPVRLGAVLAGFAGVLILLKPDASELQVWSLVPVAAGFFYAAGNVTLRERCAEERTETMLLMFFVAMGVLGLAGLAVNTFVLDGAERNFVTEAWRAPSWRLGWLLLVQAIGSLVAIGVLTRGYQSGETSLLTVFEYSFLIFSSFWGYVLWGDLLGPSDLAGIALIVLAGVVISLRTREG